jgi:formylglycine-generating enzyme required for sulfatase activity
LPTEPEWERAARGGDDRKFPWGREKPDETRMNYYPNVEHPTPVGVYPRGNSPEGVADMAGNVWEWCQDEYAPYSADQAKKPTKSSEEVRRVVRGGGWDYYPWACRVSCRRALDPTGRGVGLGFRVVCGGVGGQD